MKDPFEDKRKPGRELAKRVPTESVTATLVQAWLCPECFRKQISAKTEEHIGECCMCGALVTVKPPRQRYPKTA